MTKSYDVQDLQVESTLVDSTGLPSVPQKAQWLVLPVNYGCAHKPAGLLEDL